MSKTDDVIEVLSNLDKYKAQAEQAQHDAEEASKRASAIISDAEKQARELLNQADQGAKQKGFEFDARSKAIDQREADSKSREEAVSWVDEKQEELNAKQQQLDEALKDAEEAKIAARAEQQKWQLRSNELDDKALALEARVSKLTDWENRIRQGLPIANVV